MLITSEKLEKIIEWLNLEIEDKKVIREIAYELSVRLWEALPISEPKEIYEAARHLIGRGKMLRGILVMLVNGVYGFYNREKALRLATAIELLHTASLIHDDIIDGAKVRRGVEAVHKKFGLNVAIVATDLLISAAYHICADMGEKVIKIVSDAGKRMSEAEVMEDVAGASTINEYFKIINGKSAALIEAACIASAIVSNASEEEVKAFGNYGKLIGQVLQIKDDILDFIGTEESTGKSNPISHDLKKANIVEILMDTDGLSMEKAILKAYEMGEKIAGKAIDEIFFLKPKDRRIFEEFARIILKRPF